MSARSVRDSHHRPVKLVEPRAVLLSAAMSSHQAPNTPLPPGSALIDAAGAGDLELLREGLAQDLPPIDQLDGHGRSALGVAVLHGCTRAVSMLLEARANVNLCLPPVGFGCHGFRLIRELRAWLMLLSPPSPPPLQDDTSPLIMAAGQGHMDIVSKLIHAGADPCYSDKVRSSWEFFLPFLCAVRGGLRTVLVCPHGNVYAFPPHVLLRPPRLSQAPIPFHACIFIPHACSNT